MLIFAVGACQRADVSAAESSSPAIATTTVESTSTSTNEPTTSEPAELDPLTVQVPDIEPIRTITPDEWGYVIGQCLIDRGFAVNIMAADHLNYQGIPASQQEALLVAQAECKALYPMGDKYIGGLDDEELTRLYTYYVDTLVPCLQNEGYSGFGPPSLTTFLETYGTQMDWMPYTDIIDEVDQMAPGEIASLMAACPQGPTTTYLFGN